MKPVLRILNPDKVAREPGSVYESGAFEEVYLSNTKYYLCSGMKDKNGKWIYEGDIIGLDDGDDYIVFKVFFEKSSFIIFTNEKSCFFDGELLHDYDSAIFEIIGNEVENPDLDPFNKEKEDEKI